MSLDIHSLFIDTHSYRHLFAWSLLERYIIYTDLESTFLINVGSIKINNDKIDIQDQFCYEHINKSFESSFPYCEYTQYYTI